MFWRARTGMLFVLMTVILVAIGTFIGAIFNAWSIGLIVMLVLSVLLCIYSYYGSKGAALRANNVHIITEYEEPRLYNIVKKLAEKADLPMPEVGISDTGMPNAFATGRNPKNAAVVATRGILALLPDDELEGVFAHELSHVKNRDILVMSIASTMASVISFTSRYASYMVAFGGGNNENRGQMMLIAIALSITVPIAALLVQLGVSRNCEYLADETGARMTGNPRALARALKHIETGCATTDDVYTENSYAGMMICNPFTGKNKRFLSSLFSTHPPTEERIRRLNKLAEELGDNEERPKAKTAKKVPPKYEDNNQYLY
ncbi:MAG: zinc metalloprotease HtpX [Candidatus Methanomethylophilaceae archaeon]